MPVQHVWWVASSRVSCLPSQSKSKFTFFMDLFKGHHSVVLTAFFCLMLSAYSPASLCSAKTQLHGLLAPIQQGVICVSVIMGGRRSVTSKALSCLTLQTGISSCDSLSCQNRGVPKPYVAVSESLNCLVPMTALLPCLFEISHGSNVAACHTVSVA